MDALNFVTAMRGLVMEHVAEVHTALPVRVTSVDYGAKTVTLESIVKNTRGSEDEVEYPTLYDVPMMVNGGGNGRISFPVVPGDVGTVIFSERDPSNALQTDGDNASSATLHLPCGLYPIMFLPKIATATDSTEPLDPEKVVISNNKQSYASFAPDGTIEIYNTSGMLVKLSPSAIQISDGSGMLTLTGGNLTFSGGTVNLNGLMIDSNGSLTDGNGIDFDGHTHEVRNVESGSSTVTSNPPKR